MVTLSIELDEEQERRLREAARALQMSEQDLCREALDHYLQLPGRLNRETSPHRYAAFTKMIGLVKDGPTDASVAHDQRRDDGP